MPTSTTFIEQPYTIFHHNHRAITAGTLRIDTIGIRPSVCDGQEDHNDKFTPPLSPHREIPHHKCQIIRKSSFGSPPVSAQSWGHLNRSPAAMFLASFAAPTPTIVEEQDGDEIDDYVLDKVIGHGGFCRVWSGYCASDGHKVAVKVISASQDRDKQDQQERELAIWRTVNHPNVVMLEKLLETDEKYYCVCTYCGGGSLLDKVNEHGRLTEDEARFLFIELVQAVEYLHSSNGAGIVHKDLKLDNIFLTDDGHVKLGDFGLAVYQHQTNVEASGSLAYTSPEQVRSPWAIALPYTDMWSLGVCLYAMVAGRLPFNDTYDVRLQQKILSGRF
ncbi:kinase-like domain-containing protein, partial [Dichotomocladium elegans]